jgi:alpha-tubulin suppressor-like RCC1 family protein
MGRITDSRKVEAMRNGRGIMTHVTVSPLLRSRDGQWVRSGSLLFTALVLFACAGKGGPSPVLTGLVEIEAGWHHTCALTTAGGVNWWGNNHDGQLGDGTEVDRLTPVDVVGLMSRVNAIAAGERHTCALTTAGGVKCWGNNHDNQLGDGTGSDRVTPVDVGGLTSGVTAITAGERHTCALTTAGGVKCWGNNHDGQLGEGTGTDRNTPVDVVGLTSGVTAITAGWRHTCALTTGGEVKCWGKNHDGQLGDGTAINRRTPVDVVGLTSGIKAITAGGQHTCALNPKYVKCWGDNEDGQLGDGTTTDTLAAREEVGP